jgi:hypothetical protein
MAVWRLAAPNEFDSMPAKSSVGAPKKAIAGAPEPAGGNTLVVMSYR